MCLKMNSKVFANLEMVGETLVVLASAMWIMRAEWIPYVFAIGAILFAVGRFAQPNNSKDITLRRLFSQRRLGAVLLIVSAALMFVKGTMYLAYGVYLFPSSWLIFFAVFVVVEVYTTIRILHITK